MYLLTRHVVQVSYSHLYIKHDVPVLQTIVGAHLEHVSLLRLPVERLGEAELAGGRMQFKLALRLIVVRGLAAIAGTMMIRHQSISQSTDGIRIMGLENRDDGIGRRLFGDIKFPRAWAPRWCHVVLVQHRHAYLPQEKGMTIRSGSLGVIGHSGRIGSNRIESSMTRRYRRHCQMERNVRETLPWESLVVSIKTVWVAPRKIDYLGYRKNSQFLYN